MRTVLAAALVFAGMVGCVRAPLPEQELVRAEASILSAERLGAGGVQDAAVHLQMAREETARARELIDRGDGDRAKGYLLRAEADAELAVALAQEAPLRVQAEDAVRRARELKSMLQ